MVLLRDGHCAPNSQWQKFEIRRINSQIIDYKCLERCIIGEEDINHRRLEHFRNYCRPKPRTQVDFSFKEKLHSMHSKVLHPLRKYSKTVARDVILPSECVPHMRRGRGDNSSRRRRGCGSVGIAFFAISILPQPAFQAACCCSIQTCSNSTGL
jgi:hypothetical protein